MTTYITKVWGFGEPVGPLQFSLKGWRDRARGELRDGDLVVLVGTKGEPTSEEDQGRLLGIMEPSTEPVRSLDFNLQLGAHDYDEQQNYRWPFALLNRRVWRLLDRPRLDEISDRQFSMSAALGIVPLTDAEAREVAQLRREPAQLLLPKPRAQARAEGRVLPLSKSSPPPTTTRRGIMHMRLAEAHTYVLEIFGAPEPSFKIGWAFDHAARARQFNRASLPELGGLLYKPLYINRWDSARLAYRMEQALLKRFDAYRHRHNHEVLVGPKRKDLDRAWYSLL